MKYFWLIGGILLVLLGIEQLHTDNFKFYGLLNIFILGPLWLAEYFIRR